MVKKAPNKTKHAKLATRYGCYFSVLLELEYFDAVLFTVTDPMNDLFLGNAKRMFQLWLEKDLLTKSKLKLSVWMLEPVLEDYHVKLPLAMEGIKLRSGTTGQ